MGCFFSKSATDAKPPPYDFYRCGPLRYMGYAGHLGRACSMLLPPSVAYVPQMAATAYICADVFNKTLASADKGDKQSRVVINSFDALIWQILASIVIPGLVFNGIRSTARQMFTKQTKGGACGPKPVTFPRTPLFARLIPCTLALLATPIILRPIDRGVDYIMNTTYREWTKPCDDELLDEKEKLRRAREKKRKAEKEARDKVKQAEKDAKEKARLAEKAAKEQQDKIKQQEKEAKEKAKQKCKEEEKAWKEKMAAEEKALNEKIKREEAELKEKQAKLAKELKDKTKGKMECD